MKKISIIGGGSWGTTIAALLGNKYKDNDDYSVNLWVREESIVKDIKNKGFNTKFLPNVMIIDILHVGCNINEIIDNADILIIVVPSEFLIGVLNNLKGKINDRVIIVTATKGFIFENGKLMRASEAIKNILNIDGSRIIALSGPNIAKEIARNFAFNDKMYKPTKTMIAGSDKDNCKTIKNLFEHPPYFKVYTTHDIIGLEISGAIKNPIAILCGICDGLELGNNMKSTIFAEGLGEICCFAKYFNGKHETIHSLCGVGDLFLTCNSKDSRNHSLGELLGRGYKLEKALNKVNGIVEGVQTTKIIHEFSKTNGIKMPLIEKLYEILFRNKDPLIAIKEIMTYDLDYSLK
jgi:glycerol-3-phosphate dehydrogenase (NAD(P)+)